MGETTLELRKTGKLSGEYYVPSYQRGYRWKNTEVRLLLEDILESQESDRNYCLQPVVVKADGSRYELVDGQQRMTTLFLIAKYLRSVLVKSDAELPEIELEYARERSAEYLRSIGVSDTWESERGQNVDFLHMANAYDAVKDWFTEHQDLDLVQFARHLSNNVSVIWYEIEPETDSIELFTRLNVGRIPLTSAELVKAMLLSTAIPGVLREKDRYRIADEWDDMELRLHDADFWYFLTGASESSYATRIDFLIELVAGKKNSDKEPYATFFYFDAQRRALLKEGKPLLTLWTDRVQWAYDTLESWYNEDPEVYHMIGYLIASGTKTLREIYRMSMVPNEGSEAQEDSDWSAEASVPRQKSEFRTRLREEVGRSVSEKDAKRSSDWGYGDLSYSDSRDRDLIKRILLLFNVKLTADTAGQKFSFANYKGAGRQTKWTLEHIHAQQSEPLRSLDERLKWLEAHLQFLQKEYALGEDEETKDLSDKIKEHLGSQRIERDEFTALQERVLNFLPDDDNAAELHSISNLALLDAEHNTALGNSVFGIKREHIQDLVSHGKYVPLGTQNVFNKVYTQGDLQTAFWGPKDRKAYVEKIKDTLRDFLDAERTAKWVD